MLFYFKTFSLYDIIMNNHTHVEISKIVYLFCNVDICTAKQSKVKMFCLRRRKENIKALYLGTQIFLITQA